jgi:hypothetical protein
MHPEEITEKDEQRLMASLPGQLDSLDALIEEALNQIPDWQRAIRDPSPNKQIEVLGTLGDYLLAIKEEIKILKQIVSTFGVTDESSKLIPEINSHLQELARNLSTFQTYYNRLVTVANTLPTPEDQASPLSNLLAIYPPTLK